MQMQELIDMTKPLQDMWQGLAERERKLLSVASFFLGIAAFYWMIWSPLSQAEEDAYLQVQKQRHTLSDVKSTANQIAMLRGKAGAGQSKNLSALVSRSAVDYGIQLERLQPRGARLQVVVQQVSFAKFLEWLAFLVEEHQVSVDSIEILRTDIPGIVEIRRLQLSK